MWGGSQVGQGILGAVPPARHAYHTTKVEESALHPSWGTLQPWKEEALAALRAAILVGWKVGALMYVPDDEARSFSEAGLHQTW